MSYRNPRLVVDTKLGDAFIDYVKDVDQSISQTAVNYAQVAKKNREKNFELRKKINQYESDVNKNLAKTAIKNNVNYQSIISGTQKIVDDLAQAKMRYNAATSSYDGMDEDEALIKSTEMFLSSGLEQQLGAQAANFDAYNKAILEYGMDGKGGAVSSNSDPRFQVVMAAQNPSNNTDVSLRYEMVAGDTLLIAEGKEIEELNKAKGIEGNSYTISLKSLQQQTTADGASPYNWSSWSVIPSIMGGDVEGVPSLTKSLKEEGVLGGDGNFTKDYLKDYGTYMKSEQIKGYGKVPVIANKRAVDIDAASSMLQSSTNARINTLFGFKGDEIYDYVRTNSEEIEIDGETYFSHSPVEGRDENGNVKRGEKILISEKELANRNYEEFGQTGYSDEVIKSVQKIGLDDALKRTGALNNPIETTKSAPASMQPKPRSEEASLVSNVISSNYDLLAGGDIDEVDFSILNGLKGYQYEQDPDDQFTLLVYGKPGKEGRKVIQEIDLRESDDAERELLNIVDPKAKGIISPQSKIKLPSIVTDLTDPVNNFKDNITEESFMDSLSDDYLKKMSQLGIGLEETSIGSDVILMTKPNGQEVEIDLEEDGWKDVFERNMKGAILMSPSYKQFVSQPKKQEGGEGGKPTLDLLSFYNKLKQSESSNDTTASRVNKSGERYVGELQFGEERLSDYKNSTGASFDLDEFQNNPSLQSKVGLWHIGDIDRYIDQLGDLAKGYDKDGLRAVAHLGGKEGMKKWLESKGKSNPSDELGTSLTKYYNKFSK